MAVMHGFKDVIFNHFTLRVPGTNDRYYQIPFGMHWSEVTASCFMEISFDGERLSGEGEIERSAYCIHAPIHKVNDNAAAVFHTHMPYASALSRLKDPRILPIGQTEIGMMVHMAYDEIYTGLAYDPAEGYRLASVLGDKTALMMSNHGIATVGKTVAAAYDRLYYIERVAQVQLLAMSSNRELKFLPQDVVDHTYAQFKTNHTMYGGKSNAEWHFDALKRILDRKEPDYKD
jgi:ribulose-5-phosphate 4-epimerase/fuculose-1-phosphate aldolase